MKNKVIGGIVLCLGVVLLAAGVLGGILQTGRGPLQGVLKEAEQVQARLVADGKLEKAAASVDKKASTAASAVSDAAGVARTAAEAIQALDEGLSSGSGTGDELIDSLLAASQAAQSGVAGIRDAADGAEDPSEDISASLDSADSAVSELGGVVSGLVQGLYQEQYDKAYDAVSKAADSLSSVQSELKGVADQCGIAYAPEALELPERLADAEPAAYSEAAAALQTQAEALNAAADEAAAIASETTAYVAEMEASDVYTGGERVTLFLRDYFIGVVFTGFLLALVGVVLLFFSKQFMRTWEKYPVFSTLIALLAMVAFQTYALGFRFGNFAEWGSFWSSNAWNVLRANTSVGMIALGMTMVIIIGGIDLAVGSTLAGVGTVVMVLMDTSSRGILGKLGITGLPAYCLGIAGGMFTGLLIGAIIGLAVTKGRVPPFIATLGVMNIVRSVAQYFTKSYSLKIPTEFTGLANTVIYGQRVLPIIYWLVLAVIIYVVMKHTAFGRYVYAVGSNERTTRLSGINVDSVKMRVYMLMGLIVSIASITQLARLGNMDVASAGSGYELDAIAAVVVGGTAMSGGKGSVVGTLLGVLIIGIMNNLLILLGVDSFLTNAFKGAIVIFAVLMQRKES